MLLALRSLWEQLDASQSGEVLSDLVTLIDGLATGAASTDAVTLTVTASLIDGVASGAATATGGTVSVTASLIDGTQTANAGATGDTVTVTASLLDGTVSNGEAAPDTIVVYDYSQGLLLTPHPDDTGKGVVIVSTAKLISGKASGEKNLDFTLMDNDLLLLAA